MHRGEDTAGKGGRERERALAMAEKGVEKHGVLLYYKYTNAPIEDLNQLLTFYESNCSSLGLLGRVRIAPQGVNVTVGGMLSSLEAHIDALLEVNDGLFRGTDFKLASCDEPLNDGVARECGFTSLSIRIVKELVTLTSNPLLKSPSISNAGRHLSATEFHSVLQSAGELLKEESPTNFKRVVLLDARNLYETRIGKFETPNVETLDPATRQYSDLPAWIDTNVEMLRDNCVLMYCTGGIRCEMASAYIRSKGDGFENVFQLFGGIQRYLEQFPDGGFFKGKNFVYDPRISVGSSNVFIMGNCLLCGTSFDDYASRCRCNYCRMLVLVCNDCQKDNTRYACELCQKHGKVAQSVPLGNAVSPEIICDTGVGSSKKLRILCLHGFRQNASGFRGRTAALAKKLKSMAELVFVNAPHELAFIYQPIIKQQNGCISTLHPNPPPSRECNKKYAWLVAPDFHERKAVDWEKTDTPFDPLQYRQQTEGYDESLSYLKSVFSTEGPFDGILGFSQGAAMAALVCAQRGKLDLELDFRFVILCSGFGINLAGHEKGSVNCPSLHVFGNDEGGDRQISSHSSWELASYFEGGCRTIIQHTSGHIIPTQPPYINELVSTKLDGDGNNFQPWSRAIKIALSTESKLGFINGAITPPEEGSANFIQWQRCDKMVVSWLLNSIVTELSYAFLYTKNAREFWLELNERFGQSNGPLIFQIQREINDLYQGNDSVALYYTKLKRLWDALFDLSDVPLCTCPTTCPHIRKSVAMEHTQRLMQFLLHLNDKYDTVRGNILMMEPLPPVNKAYSMISQVERQRQVTSTASNGTEFAAMASGNGSENMKDEASGNALLSRSFGRGKKDTKTFKPSTIVITVTKQGIFESSVSKLLVTRSGMTKLETMDMAEDKRHQDWLLMQLDLSLEWQIHHWILPLVLGALSIHHPLIHNL